MKDGEFEFEWEVEDGSITITLIGKTLGYLGFGISPHGSMMEADLMLAGRRNNGSGYIQVGACIAMYPRNFTRRWEISNLIFDIRVNMVIGFECVC